VFSIVHHKKITPGFIDKNKIGGILCYKDADSIKIFKKLREWGIKVPDNISLVNYGNTELIELFEPEITAIDCCYHDMARKLEQMYENSPDDRLEQHVILPKLLIRKS